MMDLQVPVVIDTGSDTIKVGFAGELSPRTIFPSVIGRPRGMGVLVGTGPTHLVGKEAMENRGILAIKCPVEDGVITNWDDCELLWQYALFKTLKIKPENHPFLLAEKPLNPKANREKMVQIFFETFNVPALYVADTASLAMFECGKKYGVVLDGGKQQTTMVPIYEGQILPHAICKTSYGGVDLTDLMLTLLTEKGSVVSRKDAETIKIEMCSVAADFEQLNGFSHDKRLFRTSTSDTTTLDKEITQCPEALFDPALLGLNCPGIHHILFGSIMRCDEDLREKMFSNIVLSGGGTMFPGLPERLTSEMMEMVPSKHAACINVHAAWDRNIMDWQGGSAFASDGHFYKKYITSDMYDEYGPSVIHTF